jgi:hypothetical protein
VRELEEAAKEWDVDHLDEGPGWSKLTGVLGPASAFPATDQRGPSASESMRLVGLRARPADENFKSAADQIRTRLVRRTLAKGAPKSDPGIPGLRYFSTCLASLETVPSTPASKEDPDLPDKAAESAAYKVLAYACMSRPLTPERKKPRDEDWDDAPKPKAKHGSRTGLPGLW